MQPGPAPALRALDEREVVTRAVTLAAEVLSGRREPCTLAVEAATMQTAGPVGA